MVFEADLFNHFEFIVFPTNKPFYEIPTFLNVSEIVNLYSRFIILLKEATCVRKYIFEKCIIFISIHFCFSYTKCYRRIYMSIICYYMFSF